MATMATSRHSRSAWTLALLLAAGRAVAGGQSPLADFPTSPITQESALLTQTGDFNLASVEQRTGPVGAVGNYGEIVQSGAYNDARTLQEGDGNRLRVLQTGSDNLATITQTGNRNSVDLNQTGSANRFAATQTGDDNAITGLQPGMANLNVIQTGNRNVVDIDQRVSGLNVTIEQPRDGMVVRVR